MSDLHTKYRPKVLDDLRGMDALVASLRGVMEEKASRAFLFHGPAGCGKTTLARIVASTYGVEAGDLREIDAASFSGIDAMREVTALANYRGLHGVGMRCIIVDECHQLSKAAWDSLLKSVEEPPEGVVWCFCTTMLSKVPKAIVTRCAEYEVPTCSREDLFNLVLDVAEDEGTPDLPDNVASAVASAADGSPRRALTLLAKVLPIKEEDDALAMLRSMDATSPDFRAFVRDLLSGNRRGALSYLSDLGTFDSDAVRGGVLQYVAKVALGGKNAKQLDNAQAVMEAFAEPITACGTLAPAVLAVLRATEDNEA